MRWGASAWTVLAVAAGMTSGARAQEAPQGLSVPAIFASDEFTSATYRATWSPDGEGWTQVRQDDDGQDELWYVAAASGVEERLIAAAELVPGGASEPLRIEGYELSADGGRALLYADAAPIWRRSSRGRYWIFDLANRDLRPVSREPGAQMLGKLSPDASHVSFVRDHDLFVVDLRTGVERALTTDGSADVINGAGDWVYEEELALWDAYRWSPDGRRIAYWRFDQGPIRPFHMIDDLELYPELVTVRYPKAGTQNSRVRVGSLDVATGETTWFDTGPDPDVYLARMEWASSSGEVVIQRLNRHQNRLDVLLGDASTGETRLVLSETDSAWVDVGDYLTWLDGGRRFLWASERDGYNHLYLYERDGTLVRQLTRGEWEVAVLDGVDEERGLVYFTAAAPSPRERSVYAVSLSGSEVSVIAGDGGSHAAQFSPDAEFFFDRHSTITSPPTTTLRRADGTVVRVLEGNTALAARVDSAELEELEFFEVEAADGVPLFAYMIKPSGFDAARTYPLLMYVYGGPGSQTVLDRWGGSRYLWHQLLAQRGFIIVSVDNRGTGGRGRDFKKQTYLHLGELETADQLAAARQLGALPVVDPSRIGIWGWSYGAYMTLLSIFLSEGELALGISVAPVTSWELYDTIYTERFMRTPVENPGGYEQSAPLTHAPKLEASLLLVHGMGDDNVHFQNTVQLVHELEAANRQFSLRIFPNKAHAIAGAAARVNLYEMMTDYLMRHLGSAGATRPSS
ncbi:MAG: S9 family peptidase [Gemmatimonadota bacterium]